MKIVVELKMCGGSYTARYAARGVNQLGHYMTSKKSHLGYLVVFDARRPGLRERPRVGDECRSKYRRGSVRQHSPRRRQ